MFYEEAFAYALRLFPPDLRPVLESCIRSAGAQLMEIRVYTHKAIVLQTAAGVRFCLKNGGASSFPSANAIVPSPELADGVVAAAAEHIPFLHATELRRGYLTADGCRVGICGAAPSENPSGVGITSLNIRIPYSVPEQAMDPVCKQLLENTSLLLVAGPPGSGKTTFLKKCLRLLCGASMGWKRVSVIDERGEFQKEILQDPGILTADVIGGVDKAQGIQRAIRLMSPEYIVCDELGEGQEISDVLYGLNAGVKYIASIHAGCREELFRKPQFLRLRRAGTLGRVAFLSGTDKGRIIDVVEGGLLRCG